MNGRAGWGGRRPGAGRKPRGDTAGVRHAAREPVPARCPVHVRLRIGEGLPSLRRRAVRKALLNALCEGSGRFGCRVVLASVAPDGLRMILEAGGRAALGRAMQGLTIRIAKAWNRLWEREGAVFADRYEARVLRTPHEVRLALASVREGRPLEGERGPSNGAAKGAARPRKAARNGRRASTRAPEVVLEATARTDLLHRALHS